MEKITVVTHIALLLALLKVSSCTADGGFNITPQKYSGQSVEAQVEDEVEQTGTY